MIDKLPDSMHADNLDIISNESWEEPMLMLLEDSGGVNAAADRLYNHVPQQYQGLDYPQKLWNYKLYL